MSWLEPKRKDQALFSIDTSAFLDAWTRHYPRDVFPSVWTQIDRAVRDGLIKASEEVVEELHKKDDGAGDWVTERPMMIIPTTSDIQKAVTEILRSHPRLVNASKSRSGGDPFVIAVAQLHHFSVITGESASRKIDKPKIPDVCDVLKIPCVSILDFFRAQGWRI